MIKRRDIAIAIILSILTCGFYSIYWYIALTDEINTLHGKQDTSGALAFLYSILTCGIYSIYWFYKMGSKIEDIDGTNESLGLIYLLLSIFGLSIVSFALIQDKVNKHAAP